MITGAVIALLSVFIGFVVGRIQFVQPSRQTQSLACGCGHHKSFHKPKGGCVDLVPNPNYNSYASAMTTRGQKKIECACQQYTGPEAIEDIYQSLIAAPPIIERKKNG